MMMNNHTSQRNLGSIFSVGLMFVILWLLLAPIQLGGQVAYVIVSGNSMEPEFHQGDLVIARAYPSYQVGDAVVYLHPDGGHVFHRIIQKEGGIFSFQGDNNTFIDFNQLGQDAIVGKLWLHIPFGGNIISLLRTPRNMTLLVMAIMFSFFKSSKSKQNRKSKNRQHNKMKAEKSNPKTPISNRMEGVVIFGAISIGALILGLFAFSRPVQSIESDDIYYDHIGVLLYQASDDQDIYDTDLVQTGEPVFLQLTCDLQVYFGYQLDSSSMMPAEADQFTGTYHVTAQISDPNGWNRSLELAPLTDFTSTGFSAGMNLDLCHVGELITEMEEKTGTKNNWYSLAIYPEVTIIGSIAERSIDDRFAPQINFEVNQSLMRIARDIEEDPNENLASIQKGVLPGIRYKLNNLSVVGLLIPVITARWISIVALVVGITGVLWLGLPLYQEWRRGDASRIRVQYDPVLVDVQPGSISPNGQAVPVESFQDLAKLSERYGAMILYETNGKDHKYWVQDGDVMYEYTIAASDGKLETQNESAFNQEIIDAIAFDEFQLFYQPIVSTKNGQVIVMEALLRWFHHEEGLIFPSEFISKAEEAGLVGLIDNWVIEQVCNQLAKWQDEYLQPVTVSVNLSPSRLLDSDFADWISKTIKTSGCKPDYLQLELNRVNRIVNDKTALKNMDRLIKMGIRLAIDNFGAMNSNQIDAITSVPISSLKMDRSLTQRSLKDARDSRLLGAVIQIAQALNLQLVAEGIETQEQFELLCQQGINAAQGYFTGRPMPVNDVNAMLIGDEVPRE
jgi:signal peptidase I